MKISREYIKNLPPGSKLVLQCCDAANLDSVYQISLGARKLLGLAPEVFRVKRLAKELKVEVERKEVTV